MYLTGAQAIEAKHLHPGASELHGRPAVHVFDDWSVAKRREDCQPFSYTLATTTTKRFSTAKDMERNVKAQEKFVKSLGTLLVKQAREAKKRAKVKS